MIFAEELKSSLPHTWPVFFARHGNFTEAQRQAIPPILAGHPTLIMAATAAGKTEAALAPLLERHLYATPPANPPMAALRILYLCPTRALVRDLYERLKLPLESLGVALSMKSGDTGPVSVGQPPTVLITTPESTDSLLTRAPRLFTTLRALVLDEIHLFDNSPRGDHLRCLLWRIESIQRYHQGQVGVGAVTAIQRVALSATVPDPTGVAQRYLLTRRTQVDPQITPIPPILSGQAPALGTEEPKGEQEEEIKIVEVAGSRKLLAEVVPMYGLRDLVSALTLRAATSNPQAPRKTLIFCNTRNEVEQVAAYLRQELPYAAEIFVHYSNLDPAVRLAVEERFAAAPVALCVSTSTLELGIDIGSIDEVALIGPPPTLAAFLQRIGRGGRRRDHVRVLCLARSSLEELHFQAQIALAQSNREGLAQHFAPTYHFRPSILVQQVFSCLKQSPTGALRLADLRRIAPAEVSDADLRSILAELTSSRYLQAGRPGEWRAAPLLQELVDQHEIYSNIGSDPFKLLLVDAYSGQTIAQTDQVRLEGETLRMSGKVWLVVWRDRYRIGVQPLPYQSAEEELRFVTQPFAVPLEASRAIAAYLQLAPNSLCQLHGEQGAWLFHFWGDLYGTLLAAMLQAHFQREDETALVQPYNAHCLRLPAALTHLPAWDAALAQMQLQRLLPRVEPLLELGRFHALLPPALAERTVIALCDLPRFENLYRAAIFGEPSPDQRTRLQSILL